MIVTLEGDPEVLKKSAGSKQAADRQIVLKARLNSHRTTRNIQRDIMQPNLLTTANSVGDFTNSPMNINTDVSGDSRVEQASCRSAVDDRFEPPRPRRVGRRQSDLDIQCCPVQKGALSIWKYAVWEDRARARPRTETKLEVF